MVSSARVAEEAVEVSTFGATSTARVAEEAVEVSTFGATSTARVAEIVVEVAVYAIGGPARVAEMAVEVTLYGNAPEYVPPTNGENGEQEHGPGVCFDDPPSGRLSSTVVGYRPREGHYTTPVQIGTVTNLTVAISPAGRGILGWRDVNSLWVAVLDDPSDIFRDDVVGLADRRLALTLPGGLHNTSIWVDGCDLFAAVSYLTVTGDGRVECYLADDPELPSAWTLRGVLDVEGFDDGGVHTVDSGGPVTITPTGRWILPFNGYSAHGGAAPSDTSALFTSDDRGITWAIEVEHRRGALFSGTTGPIGNTVAQDPLTGYLYWSHYDGPLTNQAFVYESTDGGASWDLVEQNAVAAWQFYTDNGSDKFYAARREGSAWRAYLVIDVPSNTYEDTGVDIIDSWQTGDQFQFIPLRRVGCAAVIDKNRIAKACPAGWLVNQVAIG